MAPLEQRSSRLPLTLLLIAALSASGCQICFPLRGGEPFPFADDPGTFVGDFGFGSFACADPIRSLFLIYMGFGPGPEDGYTPGEFFLRPERPEQINDRGGSVALTLTRDGEAVDTDQMSSDLQAFDAVLEPLGAVERRLPDPQAEPPARRVFMSDADGETVTAIDPATNEALADIRVGRDPHGLAFSPDGTTLYAANNGSGSVSVIDVATLTATERLALPDGGSPVGLAVSPDGSTLYVVDGVDSGSVVVFDLASGEAVERVRVGRQPQRIRLTPDGSLAFIANFGANNISVLDTQTNTLVAALNADRPADMAVSPDGNRLYVVSAGTIGRVAEISIATLQETRSWEVGDTPMGMQLAPGGELLLVSNMNSPFLSVIDLVLDRPVTNVPAPEGLGPIAVSLREDSRALALIF